jgi:hypothetical protein
MGFAAWVGMAAMGALQAPRLSDVEHTVIHEDPATYCGHPREVLFERFAGDEIILGHYHAPCRYETPDDVRHVMYQSRSALLLQRSTDGGRTWPKKDELVLFDQTMSSERKREFLFPPSPAKRERFDMFQPEAAFLFARTYLSNDYERDVPVSFVLRSADRGRTWEKTPSVLPNPRGAGLWFYRHNTPVLRLPERRELLAAFQMAEPDRPGAPEPAVFRSGDERMSWRFAARPMVDRTGAGFFAYATLLMAGSELHCYALNIARRDETVDGLKNAICLSVSKDAGQTWSEPQPIVNPARGGGCWKGPHGETGSVYRSPYPIRLADGTLLVLFARRRMPAGIGGVRSADGGRTWSREFALRDDGAGWDLGYPVGCQLDDGRIFAAYYFLKPAGTRIIAGSFFRIE